MHESLKIFSAFYVLTGIGILVELAPNSASGREGARGQTLGTTRTGTTRKSAEKQSAG